MYNLRKKVKKVNYVLFAKKDERQKQLKDTTQIQFLKTWNEQKMKMINNSLIIVNKYY